MYKFKFSIVTAVYNVEQFLVEAIESVLQQDIGFQDSVQLILVDDGSTDNSGKICDTYKDKYPGNIVVIHKKNGGVASARNEGLKYAEGRYINFMDSDDKFTENTLSLVYEFFSQHDQDVEIVTIPLEFFDAVQGNHWQNNKFKNGTRIINLMVEYKAPLMFVNASFFVNKCKEKINFDSRLVVGEDQKVILSLLKDNMKYGVVTGCKYLYRRRSVGEESLINTSKKKYGWYFDYFTYLIDWGIETYKQHFGYLPAFIQYQFLCDLQWRVKEKYNPLQVLTEEEAKQYTDKLFATFRKFDDKYIVEMPLLYREHKNYILSKKYNSLPSLELIEGDLVLMFGNTEVCRISDCLTKIEFINIVKNNLFIEGYTKVCGLPADENIEVFLIIDDQYYKCEYVYRENLQDYRFGENIFRGIGFRVSVPITDNANHNIHIAVKIREHIIVKTDIRFGQFCPLTKKFKNSYKNLREYRLGYVNNQLTLQPNNIFSKIVSELKLLKDFYEIGSKASKKAIMSRFIYHFLRSLKRKEIWLLSDRINKADDNGEALFKYVNENDLPVNAYFVIHKDSADYPIVKKLGKVLDYHSWKHKLYHLLADKTVSSAADDFVYNSFYNNEKYYHDILYKQKRIFLQHGIIKNDLSNWLNRYNKNLALFVTSAVPEYESIVRGEYFYDDSVVKLTGMPRYDRLVDKKEKVVTIMPTWRANLVVSNNYLKNGDDGYNDKFFQSDYFKFYNELLNSKKLLDAAAKYNYKIKFMPHPRVILYVDKFKKNDVVEFCHISTKYRDILSTSSLLVTDYSSVTFDMAYMRKPVMYTQFDRDTFFEGQIYDEGYFDYERDGFGEVEYDLESTVDRIIEYMENNCTLKDMYRERIDRFFAFNDRHNCQRVYEAIKSIDV